MYPLKGGTGNQNVFIWTQMVEYYKAKLYMPNIESLGLTVSANKSFK